MIIRNQLIRIKRHGVTHVVEFDIQIESDSTRFFNIMPNYHPDDGEKFFFSESELRENI
ncbi:MAG: hypothetical protein GY694_10385 [Gammaproteobacteria bacterium]|nr:hypothetical protein [Gammaproteobacteria bacterium]